MPRALRRTAGGAALEQHHQQQEAATDHRLPDVPRFIRIDGGVVNRENAAGYLWQGDNLLI